MARIISSGRLQALGTIFRLQHSKNLGNGQ
jgi:hypothetical protein